MRVVIIEDERLSADKLSRLICETDRNIDIAAVLETVSAGVEWFSSNPMPDIVFMDIRLSDNLSFAIFDRVTINCPVIFTTAYEEFALKAFEVNSIDYLLKPIDRVSLERALNKYSNLVGIGDKVTDIEIIKKVSDMVSGRISNYKSSLLVAVKDRLIPIKTTNISYLFFEDKEITIVELDGNSSKVAGTLDGFMKQLNPNEFYRANRQFIISKKDVKDISIWFSGRVVVNLNTPTPERIVVSRNSISEFKNWITE